MCAHATAPAHLPAGQPESLLNGALDHKFRLWDAYGLLPVLCDPTRRAQPDACVVRYEAVQDIIRWGAELDSSGGAEG